jgi:hypothetical protein
MQLQWRLHLRVLCCSLRNLSRSQLGTRGCLVPLEVWCKSVCKRSVTWICEYGHGVILTARTQTRAQYTGICGTRSTFLQQRPQQPPSCSRWRSFLAQPIPTDTNVRPLQPSPPPQRKQRCLDFTLPQIASASASFETPPRVFSRLGSRMGIGMYTPSTRTLLAWPRPHSAVPSPLDGVCDTSVCV